MLRSPSIPSIVALQVVAPADDLCGLDHRRVSVALYGAVRPRAASRLLIDFLQQSRFDGQRGRLLIGVGCCFIGFCFARAVTLAISVVSFPLLLDRDVDALIAVATSIKTVRKNPIR